MSLPLLIALFAVLSFGSVSVYFSLALSKTRRNLETLESELKTKAAEEKLLEDVHETLDYSLDITRLVNVLTRHLQNNFDATTVSSLVITEKKLAFTLFAAEPVSHGYIDTVKNSMLDSVAGAEKRTFADAVITDIITGSITEDQTLRPAQTIVHMPLTIHHSPAAVITLTSTRPEAFSPEAIASIKHVLKQTSKTISRLDGALQVEKSRLTAMIEGMPDGIFMVDSKNNLQIINQSAKDLLSLHKDHLTTMDVLSALPINYDFKGKIDVAMHHNQGMEIPEIVMKNKLLSFTVSPVRSLTGEVMGVSVLMRDNTLKHSVPRMKEDFTNIIVHELRSPLTSIKASSELLISPTEFTREEQTRLIHLIYQQSNKLLTDVQQILDAAKLEAGVFTINKRQGDLKQLIREVTTLFQPEAQQKLINFIVDVDPHLPAFSFDSQQINHALTNVLSNSMKFTATGGTIQIGVKQKNGNAVITVADTGAGIPKDKQHLIFNRFSQIADASARVGKGLGLYLVRGILEAHGGKVEMDSDTGRGTTIFMTIPLTDATVQAPVVSTEQHESPRMVN